MAADDREAECPSDFQAVAAACRSLFEITIDMVLLHSYPSNLSRLLDWEKSSRFKHADAIKRYYDSRKGLQPPDDHRVFIEFATTKKDEILRSRVNHGWVDRKKQKPVDPERWTHRKLDQDARESDKARLDFAFEQFYETQYRGVPSEDFPTITGLLFPACAVCVPCAQK